jgi:hypothetical protein
VKQSSWYETIKVMVRFFEEWKKISTPEILVHRHTYICIWKHKIHCLTGTGLEKYEEGSLKILYISWNNKNKKCVDQKIINEHTSPKKSDL